MLLVCEMFEVCIDFLFIDVVMLRMNFDDVGVVVLLVYNLCVMWFVLLW